MVSLMSMRAVRKPATLPATTATQHSRPSAAMASSKKVRSLGMGAKHLWGPLEVDLSYLPIQLEDGVDILFNGLANVHLMLPCMVGRRG